MTFSILPLASNCVILKTGEMEITVFEIENGKLEFVPRKQPLKKYEPFIAKVFHKEGKIEGHVKGSDLDMMLSDRIIIQQSEEEIVKSG